MSTTERKNATSHTRTLLAASLGSLPFEDRSDFDRAIRGKLAEATDRQIIGRFGHAVWDLDAYEFESAAGSDSVHPSLWRQAQLNNASGLFQVTDGVYQVRGLDISNITFIRGHEGWIVIDPLTGTETAAASLQLINSHLGERPVKAVIYTHSHTDHFGGILGVVTEEEVSNGSVEIFAPAGFLEAAVSENVIAGTAMLRRAMYMYGVLLPKDELGHVDTGLGKSLPAMPGVTLIAPTIDIHLTGERHVVDGVILEFQMTPGTEAPAEMNIFLPDFQALCLAENCTANLHNLYTLRGAQVRDALGWSKYINECLTEFLPKIDVAFASHHWPRWGVDEIREYLENQRDLYRSIHDQTMRLANHGLTMNEIAEEIALPPHLAKQFYNRDYYGTVRHNAKAVYQRYLGWFDANPAHLNPHTPVEAGKRYVEFIGGSETLLAQARSSFEKGDYRWVCEVVNHLVFAEPENIEARYLQADALEQLGYQSESGPWRDFYLTGAQELRAGGSALKGVRGNSTGPSFMRAMTMNMMTDVIGVRLNGPATKDLWLTISVTLTDRDEPTERIEIRGGVLSSRHALESEVVDIAITCEQSAFARFAGGSNTIDEIMGDSMFLIDGDLDAMRLLENHLDIFEFGFEVVLP
ncbi:MAG: MBL fold metallo-hydrolase [Actinobacteria bacterium]|nr:MBL fold metallo-hydrolase [Actinomycetota bacterium]